MGVLDCSVLIHSRTNYMDFRNGFLVRPGDFSDEDVKEIKKLILQTTVSAEELLANNICRKVVIANQNHVICGITASMHYFSQYNNDLTKIEREKNGRSLYLFVGVVIRKKDIIGGIAFPQTECLAKIAEKYIGPRWEDEIYDGQSKMATVAGYNEVLENSSDTISKYRCVNLRKDRIQIHPHSSSDEVINACLDNYTSETGVCTNFSYRYDAEKSDFLNVTVIGVNDDTIVYKEEQESPAEPNISKTKKDENTNAIEAGNENQVKHNEKEDTIRYIISFEINKNKAEEEYEKIITFFADKGIKIEGIKIIEGNNKSSWLKSLCSYMQRKMEEWT